MYSTCINFLIYHIWFSSFVPMDLSYHLLSFPFSNIAVFPSLSIMLLLANILHFYVIGPTIQLNTCCFIKLLLKSVKRKTEKHTFILFFFFFGCVGSSLLHMGFLQLRRAGATLLQCAGFSSRWLLVAEHRLQVHGLQQLWCVGSIVVARGLQSAGSVVMVHRLTCSRACGIFPDQGSNPCLLHWQADS